MRLVKPGLNDRFPTSVSDGMTFADLLHYIHRHFLQNETTEDPSSHDQFTAEKNGLFGKICQESSIISR
jgi:hypothetical protein